MYDHRETLNTIAPEDFAHVEKMLAKLDAYGRSDGRAVPGDFLTAIIVGDLYEAALKADDVNRKYLPEYCKYVYNQLSSDLIGLATRPLGVIKEAMGRKTPLVWSMVAGATPEFQKALRTVTG